MNKFIVSAFAFAAAISAQASYLYWQVDATDIQEVNSWAVQGGTDWGTAILYAVDEDGNKTVVDYSYNGSDGAAGTGFASQSSVDLSKISGAANYSYYVELVSGAYSGSGTVSGTVIGSASQAMTYTQLQEADMLYDTELDASSIQQAQVWHGGSGGYRAAPEPTSAMLMLLGVAGLALRRKQRKLA